MNAAASVAGIISFADLVLKYATILSVWKDAPPVLHRIRELLSTLSPILEELRELHKISRDTLLSQGINTGAFEQDLKALADIANDTLVPGTKPKLLKRATWVLKHQNEATELGKKLGSHIEVFTCILALLNQKSVEGMKEQAMYLANSQLSIQTTMLEALCIAKSVNTQISIPESRVKEPPTAPRYPPAARQRTNTTNICASRVLNKRHEYSCPGAELGVLPSSLKNCDCEDCGLALVRYRSSTTVAPHSGQLLNTKYLFEVDFTTWKTIFGQFRFLLSVRAQQQAWSLSLSAITFSKQNIVSLDAPIFKFAQQGNFKGMVELFRLGLASPNDRTTSGRTPLLHAAHENQLEAVAGLISEGADVNALWSSSGITESVLFHSVLYGTSDELSTLLLNRGADPFVGVDSPERLFEMHMIGAGNRGPASSPKLRTLMILGTLLSNPKDIPADEDTPNPLQQALKWGSLEGTQIALRAGYDVNAPFRWPEHPYERAPRPTIPVIFAASRIHSRAVWHESGPVKPNRGPILRELVRHGANLMLAEAGTGSTVLHHVLSGTWWDGAPIKSGWSYVILCQLVVFLIKNGADPGAVNAKGQSPSDIAWEPAVGDALIQRRVLVWYRSLRMCGLHPAVYDKRYDSRFDRSSWHCVFCAFDAGVTREVSFVACPWCIGEAYGIWASWHSHDNWRHRSNPRHKYSSIDNLDGLGPQVVKESDLYPCCPMFACLWHYPRASSGVRLPRKPGRPMEAYSEVTPNSSFDDEVVAMLRSWGVTGVVDPNEKRHAECVTDEGGSEEEQEQEQISDSGKGRVGNGSVGKEGQEQGQIGDSGSVCREEQEQEQAKDYGEDCVNEEDEDELFYDALEEIEDWGCPKEQMN